MNEESCTTNGSRLDYTPQRTTLKEKQILENHTDVCKSRLWKKGPSLKVGVEVFMKVKI
jgi:hypothetical protein